MVLHPQLPTKGLFWQRVTQEQEILKWVKAKRTVPTAS
jgi:hypothetical protein